MRARGYGYSGMRASGLNFRGMNGNVDLGMRLRGMNCLGLNGHVGTAMRARGINCYGMNGQVASAWYELPLPYHDRARGRQTRGRSGRTDGRNVSLPG